MPPAPSAAPGRRQPVATMALVVAALALVPALGGCARTSADTDSVDSPYAAGSGGSAEPPAVAPHAPDPRTAQQHDQIEPHERTTEQQGTTLPPPLTVAYEADGSAGTTGSTITYSIDADGTTTTLRGQVLPWRITVGVRPGETAISLSITGHPGPYLCRILVDGVEQSTAGSVAVRGGRSTVTCTARLAGLGRPDAHGPFGEAPPPPAG